MKMSYSKLAPLVIFATALIIWHQTLNQVFLGEGYEYFDQDRSTIGFDIKNIPHSIGTYSAKDNFGRFFNMVLIPIFKDSIFLYQLTQIIIYAVLAITIYIVFLKITKSNALGFITTLLFVTNYSGSFEMMAEGYWKRYVERVPNMIPAIIAIYFLDRHLTSKKIRYFFLAVFLFAISVFMGHFTTFILPFFAIYPIVRSFKKNQAVRSFIKSIPISLTFIIINYLMIFRDGDTPDVSLFYFITNTNNILERVLFQILEITVPYKLITTLAEVWPNGPLTHPFLPILRTFLVPVLAGYVLGAVLVYKKKKKLFSLYLTSFLTMIVCAFQYTYADPVRINPLNTYGAGRHLFVSSIFFSIIIATIINTIFTGKKSQYKHFFFFLLFLIIANNMYLISTRINQNQYRSEALRRYIAYAKSISWKFNENTILITSPDLQWPSPLINRFYVPTGMRFNCPLKELTSSSIDKNNVFVITYDYEISPEGVLDAKKGRVVDLTESYRAGEKIDFLQVENN